MSTARISVPFEPAQSLRLASVFSFSVLCVLCLAPLTLNASFGEPSFAAGGHLLSTSFMQSTGKEVEYREKGLHSGRGFKS